MNLGFERPEEGGGDGSETAFEVSLMRGNAEYFAQLRTKNTMQEEVRSSCGHSLALSPAMTIALSGSGGRKQHLEEVRLYCIVRWCILCFVCLLFR